MYHLTRNPEKLLKAQAEVDRVVGNGALELKHLPQLKYVEACIRETLRVKGPISVYSRHSKQDTVIGGRYGISSKTSLILNLNGLHHDPKIWGDDHDVFRPERMLDGGFEALPPNSWHPFGSGMRSCIGRTFAEQEMMVVVALILQRFQCEMADPSYELSKFGFFAADAMIANRVQL
jgi:cytochrome P450/NADPH-cytochrome P450 reductase